MSMNADQVNVGSKPSPVMFPAQGVSAFGRIFENQADSRYPPGISREESRAPPSGVSLVLPAFNEEERIRSTLGKYIAVLGNCGRQFEIVVVVDGTDRTADVASKYEDQGVRVLRENRKLGKGGAILWGFRHARFDAIGYVDADGSLSPTDLEHMVHSIIADKADCVVASRWIRGSRWIHKEPLIKRFVGRVFNVLVRSLLQIPVRDTQCGAKFYRRDVIDRLIDQMTVTNLTTDVGFLFHAYQNGAKILEVPVTWDDDSRSRFHVSIMIPIMFLTIIGIRLMNLPMGKYVPTSLVAGFQRILGSI